MSDGSTDISYTYNDNGIRQSKTVNNVKTIYTTVNGRITSQKTGNDMIMFRYDESDKLIGFKYNGTEYFYILNLQGDVSAILDNNGSLVVEYTYDAWGNCTSINGSMANTLGVMNPMRYRGYYWDSETGLYYLQSRYYNPEWGRFINADEALLLNLNVGDILGQNMFAYCYNNPIMFIDINGMWPIAVIESWIPLVWAYGGRVEYTDYGPGYGYLFGAYITIYGQTYSISGWRDWLGWMISLDYLVSIMMTVNQYVSLAPEWAGKTWPTEVQFRNDDYPNHKGSGNRHYGTDFYSSDGAKTVFAAISGIVIETNKSAAKAKKPHNDPIEKWAGNYVVIKIPSGAEILYAHMQSYNVQIGQAVKKGVKIGVVGETGNAPNGKHLHYEVWVDGKDVHPKDYLPK